MSRQFQEIDEAASYLRRGRMFSLPASALGFESAFAQALAGGQVRPGDAQNEDPDPPGAA